MAQRRWWLGVAVPLHGRAGDEAEPLTVIVGLLPMGVDVGVRPVVVGAGLVTVSMTVKLTVAPLWSVTVTVA